MSPRERRHGGIRRWERRPQKLKPPAASRSPLQAVSSTTPNTPFKSVAAARFWRHARAGTALPPDTASLRPRSQLAAFARRAAKSIASGKHFDDGIARAPRLCRKRSTLTILLAASHGRGVVH